MRLKTFALIETAKLAVDLETNVLLEGAGRVLFVLLTAVIAAALVRRITGPVLGVAIRRNMADAPEVDITKRIQTLSDVIYRTCVVLIGVLAVLTILPEFGIQAGPLIAGLGLVGIAVGFGAQNLVRDVINGLEILIENQYARGDYVKLGAFSGIVEDINLRRTVLRDFDGNVHFVSHGHIEAASNFTRGFSRVNFNVVVAYTADLEQVFDVINRTGAELAAEADWAPRITEPPRASGIDKLGEASLEVRVTGATLPGEQWAVAAELRRRLKLAFDAANIRIRDAPPAP